MHLLALFRPRHYNTASVYFGKYKFKAFIADSFAKKMFGLMFWKGIGKKECMLFVLDKPAKAGIWMLNMQFPIDIVWVSEDKRVVSIVKNAEPCKGLFGCTVYYPDKPAKYILEFGSKTASKIGLRANSTLEW